MIFSQWIAPARLAAAGVLLFGLATGMAGCKEDLSERSRQAASELSGSIERYEARRNTMAQRVADAQAAVAKAGGGSAAADRPVVANQLTEPYDEGYQALQSGHEELARLATAMDDAFEHNLQVMQDISAGVTADSARLAEEAKTAGLRANWKANMAAITERHQALARLGTSGSDVVRGYLAESMRNAAAVPPPALGAGLAEANTLLNQLAANVNQAQGLGSKPLQ